MNEQIRKHIEADEARRVWQTDVPGVGAKVVCYRSDNWRHDKLVIVWPSGDWELFEMVRKQKVETRPKCAFCGCPMPVVFEDELWCGRCAGPTDG